jgi:cytochrome c oxidase cbb3-type subunit 3
VENRETDAATGVETTGHDWDGIKELNNPLPRWWLWTFYATIIWSIGYVIAYPAIPLVTDATKGVLGYTSRGEVAAEMAAVEAARSDKVARIAELSINDIAEDKELYQFAVSAGRSAYKVHCSQCHGSGATGAAGYPNLNDDDWLWAGDLEGIAATIRHGVRFAGDDDSRFAEMPAFGRDQLLGKSEIASIAAYVASFSNIEHDPALAGEGEPLYATNCAACHGAKGEGDRDQGAPNLRDPIWLYGGTLDEIIVQIGAPKHGVMPGWGDRLGEPLVKQLAIYVHSLGGGE